MIIYVPLLVAIVGALCYLLSANGKVQELGRIGFFCGLLVFLWQYAGSKVSPLG